MGRRGPRPTPSALKRAAQVRTDRINEGEPRPLMPEGPPAPPPHLDEVAAEVWCRLVPELHACGVLTPWDLHLFSRFCELESIAREAWSALREYGTVVEGRRDKVVTSPFWRVYRDAIDRQRALAHEFGLTPSGRSEIRFSFDRRLALGSRLA